MPTTPYIKYKISPKNRNLQLKSTKSRALLTQQCRKNSRNLSLPYAQKTIGWTMQSTKFFTGCPPKKSKKIAVSSFVKFLPIKSMIFHSPKFVKLNRNHELESKRIFPEFFSFTLLRISQIEAIFKPSQFAWDLTKFVFWMLWTLTEFLMRSSCTKPKKRQNSWNQSNYESVKSPTLAGSPEFDANSSWSNI